MKNFTLLSGTAIVLLMSGVHAGAATCSTFGLAITCDQPDSDPVAQALDGGTVTVASGADVTSDDENASPVALEGNATTLTNDGAVVQQDNGGQAVLGSGDGVTVINNGDIDSGDRGIVMDRGSLLDVYNAAGATISARRQAVRAEEDSPGAVVENHGKITSSEGRALQLRSFEARVINHGALIGGEEVVEARGDFYLENHGTIALNDPGIEDEDGVQFAGGEVQNYGSITGSDDGIDVDEGLIVNHAGGVIRSTAPDANQNSGVDVDPEYDDEINPLRASGALTIMNAGLIEGPTAIGTDSAATNEVTIINEGTLDGRGGVAIRMAPGQGASSVMATGQSEIHGDVLFGNSDDAFLVGEIASGLLVDGVIDGRGGVDIALFDSFELADFTQFDVSGNAVSLAFFSAGDQISANFLDFENWSVSGTIYDIASLEAAIGAGPAVVPLPAGLPLLLAGLGGLAMIRRKV